MIRQRSHLALALMAMFASYGRSQPRASASTYERRKPEETERLLAAAQAKRDRRYARNLALLRAEEARKSAA
jgi:hypothetical protein